MGLSVSTTCAGCGKDVKGCKLRAGFCPKCYKSMFGVKRHKFHASPTTVDDIRFDSKREAKRYEALKLAQKAGEVAFFLRQPRFDLPGKTKYYADFLVFWEDGTVTIEDTKGHRTSEYKLKKRQVEELYPIKIREL